jgi:two-component system OmpR family response regulator
MGGEQVRILAVDDDPQALRYLHDTLTRAGYAPVLTGDPEEALGFMEANAPHLALLDLMLPGTDGIELMRDIRAIANIPVIFLSAYGQEDVVVRAFDTGADDYVVKPFSMRELVARAKAMLRRTPARHSESAQVLVDGDLELNLTSHEVTLRDAPLELKPREFDLLALLMQNRSRIYTRNQILDQVWGYDFVGDMRTVDVHVRWLREKIEDDPGSPKRIVTVRGVGYRFQG